MSEPLRKHYSSFIAASIMDELEHLGFTLDRESELGGIHATLDGARVQIIDNHDRQKYEILIRPIRRKVKSNEVIDCAR